jgi:uncharacterized protein with LGFP repeats
VRRLLSGLIAFLALSGVVLVLPVYAAPQPSPEPVAVSTEAVAMGSVAAPAAEAELQQGTTEAVPGVPENAPALTVSDERTDDFSLVGLTWTPDPAVTDTVVQVRTRDADGRWGQWQEVATEASDQNAGTRSGATPRGGTVPLWTGPSRGVEAELVTRSGARPTDVRLELVDPGTSDADGALGAPDIQDEAEAAASMPPIFSRAQWGADESLRTWRPQYAPTITAATLHHTDTLNNYSADEVPAILRAMYSFHAVSRGWGDIGYNVITDRFGRLWEGRSGGLSSTVIGAHAGGFNAGTFGVSIIGNFVDVDPSQAAVDSVSAVVAWKFGLHRVDPWGSTTLTSGGGGTSMYAPGARVTLPTIFGHRDVGNTTCPGDAGYARLPDIRDNVAARMGVATTIAGRYAADAGLRSLLGAPQGGEQSAAGVSWQVYDRGRLYSSPSSGVRVLGGAILTKYLAAGGPGRLGAPRTDELTTPDGRGRFNHFTRDASIYWTPDTGATVVEGAIRQLWASRGWEGSRLGYPTSDELAFGVARYSTFQNGAIHWTPASGAHTLQGAMRDKWQALGGLAWRGPATTDELSTPDGGRFQHFWDASLYSSQASGMHAVEGAIRTLWSSLGWERGPLRYPTSDELVAADGTTRYTTFQNGAVYWTRAAGAHAVQGAIEDKWQALGGLAWGRGVPTTNELTTPDTVGRFNHFTDASIYWSPASGTHAVEGAIRTLWASTGWEGGPLGYPTSDELVAADGFTRYTTFQNGAVYWTAGGGAHAVQGGIEDKWQALGGLAWGRGVPTTNELTTPDTVGRFNHFTDASIYWSPASGVRAVEGSIRARWSAMGWELGALGYPTSDEQVGARALTRYSTFQNGVIYWNPATGTHSVQGAIATRYTALGGEVSPLGLPTSDEYAVPGGRRSDFQRGTLTWDARTRAVTATYR